MKNKTPCPACGKHHFGHCHKCPHDSDVKAGKYNGVQFSKSPCSACRLPIEYKVSGHGVTVPLEDKHHEQTVGEHLIDDRFDAFARVLTELWSLPFITREIVARRLQGQKWEDIATTLNLKHAADITMQACHLKLKSALDRSESLRVLFAAMIIKQQTRRTLDV